MIEADDHARVLLERNGIPVQALIAMLRALEAASRPSTATTERSGAARPDGARDQAGSPRVQRYLMSHPDMEERIGRLATSPR